MPPQLTLPDTPAFAAVVQPGDTLRRAGVFVLYGASQALARAARHLAASRAGLPAVPLMGQPQIEFHADAGALEGALYVNGQLVGMLPGVKRL